MNELTIENLDFRNTGEDAVIWTRNKENTWNDTYINLDMEQLKDLAVWVNKAVAVKEIMEKDEGWGY